MLRGLQLGEKAKVYRNVNNNKLSIQQKTEKGWRVVGHACELVLDDCEFVVSEAGRQRVLQTGRKNVHAKVTGILNNVSNGHFLDMGPYQYLTAAYNPYKYEKFWCLELDKPVRYASRVILRDNGKIILIGADCTS